MAIKKRSSMVLKQKERTRARDEKVRPGAGLELLICS